MDKFIKTKLSQIKKEAENITLCVAAIQGSCAGQESGIEYLLQQQNLRKTELNKGGVQKEMTFGERLRDERKKKGLTQVEVASYLGLCQSSIAKYELDIKEPTQGSLIALSKLYGVSTDYLLLGK